MMKIVIAGSYAQYRRYLEETQQSPKDVRYISSPEQLRGLRNVEIIKYGTWWESPVAGDEYLKTINLP